MYGNSTGLTAYATARGVTLTTDLDVLLTKAHDYIESLLYNGTRTVETQTDSFPRIGLYVDGILLDSETVPQRVIDAEYAAAISIDQDVDPLAAVEQSVKKEKVDVIETEYRDGSSSLTYNRTIMALLKPLLSGGGAFRVMAGR